MVNYKSYSIEENEHLYGPGKRLLLFLQGCSIRCKGCVNQHLWPFGTGTDISAAEVVALCHDLEGITLHGGEPLDQSDGLFEIVKALKEQGKTIVLFTGYRHKELVRTTQKKVWQLADLVVSGRFVESKKNIYLQFRGSTNQRVYAHRGKYQNYRVRDGKSVGIVRLSEDGVFQSRGFRTAELQTLINELTNSKY